MAWLLPLKPDFTREATPFVSSAPWPRNTARSQNETIPEGMPLLAGFGATIALKVTESSPPGVGVAEFRLVRVAFAWTFCTRVALPFGNVASPLYVAVMKW